MRLDHLLSKELLLLSSAAGLVPGGSGAGLLSGGLVVGLVRVCWSSGLSWGLVGLVVTVGAVRVPGGCSWVER